MLCSIVWISWPLKLGLIACSKRSTWNYHSTLHNIWLESTPQSILLCRPWFGSAWFISEQFSLVFHIRISDDLTYWSSKFKGKKMSYSIRVNMVYSGVLLEVIAYFMFMASHRLHACCRLRDSGNIHVSKKSYPCVSCSLYHYDG